MATEINKLVVPISDGQGGYTPTEITFEGSGGSGLPDEVITYQQFQAMTEEQKAAYTGYISGWPSSGGGSGSTGILPHIIVISETGSTVTATKGQTVITATETSTGHFECDLTEFGTWTIDAVLGGDDAQVSLVVDTVKVYTVDDSHFHATVTVKYPSGATCRLQSADETLYATSSPYTFTVHHAETYTITVTYNQRIYTDTVTFTTEGQSFSKTLPSPTDADANDINFWLWFGGVSGSYSSLSDILADSTALATLMASTDAVDYLVRCTNWISDICGNQSAMSYIGLNNYCANTLLADSDWRNGICNSTYFESVLNVKIPTMTSNTAPSGVCSASKTSDGEIWKAFDSSNTSYWAAYDTTAWIQYKFDTPCRVCELEFYSFFVQIKTGSADYVLKGSNDGTTFNTITSGRYITTQGQGTQKDNFSNDIEYTYYRVELSNTNLTNWYSLQILQMFGREDV